MNKRVNMPSIQNIMREFEKENMAMEMKEDIMNDAMDEAFTEEGDEAATDEILAKVFDEFGIKMSQSVNTLSLFFCHLLFTIFLAFIHTQGSTARSRSSSSC